MGGNDPETAHSIAIRCNKTTQTILHMPLRSSWIFRRGEKPFMCRNLELDTYMMLKGIVKKEIGTGPITVEQNTKEGKIYNCTERDQIEKAG